MKTIAEYNKESIGEVIKKYINSPWYFNQWYEKLILLGLTVIAIIKILQWII